MKKQNILFIFLLVFIALLAMGATSCTPTEEVNTNDDGTPVIEGFANDADDESCPIDEEAYCPDGTQSQSYTECITKCRETRDASLEELESKIKADHDDCLDEIPISDEDDGTMFVREYSHLSCKTAIVKQNILGMHSGPVAFADFTNDEYTACIDAAAETWNRILDDIISEYKTCKDTCTNDCFGITTHPSAVPPTTIYTGQPIVSGLPAGPGSASGDLLPPRTTTPTQDSSTSTVVPQTTYPPTTSTS